jgi:hypothetical protein
MTKANEVTEQEFKIPIESLFSKFENHLKIKNNTRILFSGKFGIGKTYFLNEFFKNKEEDYEVFHLFPVNYQITSNENIIEFLKYDILVELLKKNKNILPTNDYNNLIDLERLLYLWGKDNLVEVFKKSVSLIPKLGRPLKDVIGLIESFLKFKKNMETGDQGFIDTFLDEIKDKNISETDPLSELLKQKINKQKKKKQSVLILDDLERIDPEHIFRIINIFFAHFDLYNKEIPNKFCFDKIILVADVQNIKSIFHYKYGKQTDFNGYFDKFFSVEVFQFKNEEIIVKIIDQIISNFQIEDIVNLDEAFKTDGILRVFLEVILKKSLEMTGKEKLNLRQLLKGIKFPLSAFKKGHYKKGFSSDWEKNVCQIVDIGIEALISIFGGLDGDFLFVLIKIKQNLKSKKGEDDHIYKIFSQCLLIKVSPIDKRTENLKYEWQNYSIDFAGGKMQKVNYQNSEINAEYLLYDLLIEYVKGKLYQEKNKIFNF